MQDIQGHARSQPLLLYATVFAIGLAGLLIKMPFGLFLFHVMGKQPLHPHTLFEWLMTDYTALGIVVVACFLHRFSGLPLAPRLERFFSREARADPKSPMWWPGVAGAGVTLMIFVVSQVYQVMSGAAIPIASKLDTHSIPHGELITLAMLFPLAFIGAPLSEEVFYRFGFLSVLMGLMSFVKLGGRNPNNAIAFWIANVMQGAWFGFIHVQQGIVAAQHGSLAFQIAVAPQTYGGIVFGVVYRRWGLEAAIIAHMLSDICAPLVGMLWGYMHHH
jgi:membrane protease YdiL (CAAX protease family)